MTLDQFASDVLHGRLKHVTPAAIAVYSAIAVHYERRVPMPSYEHVAACLGVSTRTVFRAVRQLRSNGIEIEKVR